MSECSICWSSAGLIHCTDLNHCFCCECFGNYMSNTKFNENRDLLCPFKDQNHTSSLKLEDIFTSCNKIIIRSYLKNRLNHYINNYYDKISNNKQISNIESEISPCNENIDKWTIDYFIDFLYPKFDFSKKETFLIIEEIIIKLETNALNESLKLEEQINNFNLPRPKITNLKEKHTDKSIIEIINQEELECSGTRCPKCNDLWFKDDKCSHVTCLKSYCNCKFCFICGYALEPTKSRDGNELELCKNCDKEGPFLEDNPDYKQKSGEEATKEFELRKYINNIGILLRLLGKKKYLNILKRNPSVSDNQEFFKYKLQYPCFGLNRSDLSEKAIFQAKMLNKKLKTLLPIVTPFLSEEEKKPEKILERLFDINKKDSKRILKISDNDLSLAINNYYQSKIPKKYFNLLSDINNCKNLTLILYLSNNYGNIVNGFYKFNKTDGLTAIWKHQSNNCILFYYNGRWKVSDNNSIYKYYFYFDTKKLYPPNNVRMKFLYNGNEDVFEFIEDCPRFTYLPVSNLQPPEFLLTTGALVIDSDNDNYKISGIYVFYGFIDKTPYFKNNTKEMYICLDKDYWVIRSSPYSRHYYYSIKNNVNSYLPPSGVWYGKNKCSCINLKHIGFKRKTIFEFPKYLKLSHASGKNSESYNGLYQLTVDDYEYPKYRSLTSYSIIYYKGLFETGTWLVNIEDDTDGWVFMIRMYLTELSDCLLTTEGCSKNYHLTPPVLELIYDEQN